MGEPWGESGRAQDSRLWPPSLNTHYLTNFCITFVAIVLKCVISQDPAGLQTELQYENRLYAMLACVSGSTDTFVTNHNTVTFHVSHFH